MPRNHSADGLCISLKLSTAIFSVGWSVVDADSSGSMALHRGLQLYCLLINYADLSCGDFSQFDSTDLPVVFPLRCTVNYRTQVWFVFVILPCCVQ